MDFLSGDIIDRRSAAYVLHDAHVGLLEASSRHGALGATSTPSGGTAVATACRRKRTAGDGLRLFPEIIELSREIPIKGERRSLRHFWDRARSQTCGDDHAQDAVPRAAAIDCLHECSLLLFESS
jgi:hypothetical protein